MPDNSYSPHDWDVGDVITDTSLNHIETGLYNLSEAIGSGAVGQVSIISPSDTTLTLAPCPITYRWDTVASLTLTVTNDTQYHFMFTCPNNAATSLVINGITGTAGDTIAAGNTYEVDIWGGIALIRQMDITAAL